MVDKARVMNEVFELAEFAQLEYEIDSGEQGAFVIVCGLNTPGEWTPDEVDIQFELPAQYPAHPPRVYVPDTLRFNGQRHRLMAPPAISDETKWCPFNIEGATRNWDPDRDSLKGLLSQFIGVLENETPPDR